MAKIIDEYNRKRDFVRTSEPRGTTKQSRVDNKGRFALGLVAKHKSSVYKQGIRSRDWLKIKHIKTQDCVVIGYTSGEGNKESYFGSLLLAIYDPNTDKLRFVGHTGSDSAYHCPKLGVWL